MRIEKIVMVALIVAAGWAGFGLFSAQEQPTGPSAGQKSEETKVQAENPAAAQAGDASTANNPLQDLLTGLKKAEPGEIPADRQIVLNPDVMPMYSPEWKRLMGREFVEVIMSGNFVPEPYVDGNKEVKAFVLRSATEEEKKQLRAMLEENEPQSPAPGKEAKPFSVTDLKGKKYSLEKMKGKVVVVNFWFMECRPCRMEIPELNKVVEKYRGKDVVFLGMSTNKAAQLETFLAKNEFKYEIVADSAQVAAQYGVTGFPTHMVIDRDSKVAYFASGFGPGTIDKLSEAIDKLMKK